MIGVLSIVSEQFQDHLCFWIHKENRLVVSVDQIHHFTPEQGPCALFMPNFFSMRQQHVLLP